jgi:hypothetical protein
MMVSEFSLSNTNKRAGWNRCAGGNFFSKPINVQTKIRPCRGDFFLKINKRACTSIRYTRVVPKNLLDKIIHRELKLDGAKGDFPDPL